MLTANAADASASAASTHRTETMATPAGRCSETRTLASGGTPPEITSANGWNRSPRFSAQAKLWCRAAGEEP